MFYLHQRNFCSSVNGLRISKSNSRKLLEHIGVPWQKGIHFSQSSHIFIYINIIFFFFLSLWEKHWLKEKCWIDWQGARTLGSARQAPLDSFVSWIFFFFLLFLCSTDNMNLLRALVTCIQTCDEHLSTVTYYHVGSCCLFWIWKTWSSLLILSIIVIFIFFNFFFVHQASSVWCDCVLKVS